MATVYLRELQWLLDVQIGRDSCFIDASVYTRPGGGGAGRPLSNWRRPASLIDLAIFLAGASASADDPFVPQPQSSLVPPQ